MFGAYAASANAANLAVFVPFFGSAGWLGVGLPGLGFGFGVVGFVLAGGGEDVGGLFSGGRDVGVPLSGLDG